MNQTQLKIWISALSLLAPIAHAQTFSPTPGGKEVTITALPPDFTGEIYCRVAGGKPGKRAIKSPADPQLPFKLPCGRKLVSGEQVEVYLVNADNKQVALVPQTVPATTVANASKGPLWKPSLSANSGDHSAKVTVSGIPPQNIQPSQIQVLSGPPPGTNITASAATGPDATGTFTVPLTTAVNAGDQLFVNINGTIGTAVAGGGAAGHGVASTTTKDITVTFTPDPKDTQTTIAGILGGDTADLSTVQAVYVEVLNGKDVVQGPLDGTYSTTAHTFKATSATALAEGQTIHIHVCGSPTTVSFTGTTAAGQSTITAIPSTAAMKPGLAVTGNNIPQNTTIVSVDSATQITISSPATAAAAGKLQFAQSGDSCPQPTSATKTWVEITAKDSSKDVTSLYDLGRLKTYFSVGAQFQGSNGSLGSTSGFFAVAIDENWLTTGPAANAQCFSPGDSPKFKQQAERDHAADQDNKTCNSHPARFLFNTYAVAELTQIPLTSSSSNSNTTPSGGGTAMSRHATTPASSSTFSLASAKGAYVEGGIYTPILLPAMQWRYRGQSNAFFVAPLAKYVFLDPDTTPNGATTSFNVYRAYGGGLRIGHFRLPANFDKHGPELLSFIDITGGKWENYREQNGTRGARLDVTSRYKIPYTLLYIGFDANLGPGGSDFRLFVGTRVDVASILGKLLPSTN